MLTTDIPYLDPLLMWLRADEDLKKEFTEKSFFMPHADLLSAVVDLAKKDCPSPRALWIFPGDSQAVQQRPGCRAQARHQFSISIFLQCIRNSFELSKTDNGIHLSGQFMEMTKLRKIVKSSVHKFSLKEEGVLLSKPFEGLRWTGDRIMYPREDFNLLGTSIEFEVLINP